LTHLVSNLDTAASDLVEHQKESVVQRKDLAQKTKDFRKLDDSAKLTEIKGLLKAYQNFIDLLTNQSKSVSSAFLSAYTPLSDAPDPYPLLEASIESLVTAEETVPRLENENKHLQGTITKLTSQLEETETQLEVERDSRQLSETNQDSKIKDIGDSWAQVLKEKEDNWTSKERSLEDKVDNQDRLLRELKASYEVSQRLEKAEGDDQGGPSRNAADAELEILNSELDKANVRLSEVQARNEQLRLELAQASSQSGNSQKATSVEDDPAFRRLRSENSSLLRKLDAARYEKGSEQGKLESRMRSLEREIAALTDDRESLRKKIEKYSDYDEVKQELEMLRTVEFATGDDAELDEADGHGNGSGKGESLEQLLLARNKKLGNEVTELRISHRDLQSQFEELQDDLSSANMELEKSRVLNATLENDLQKAQTAATNAFDPSAMSVAGTYTSRYPKSAYASRRGGATSPTSSIISGFDGNRGSPTTLESLRGGEAMGGGSGILPMVTAQRDRFKTKISQMETELQKAYKSVSSLRSEVASLQKDNLNLYEKTRYVSTYNRPTASASSFSANPNPSTIQMGSDPSDRYRSAYESNISPFAAFRGRESARAFKRMTLPERIVYQITRMVLATRTSRNVFALYCVGLHMMVFILLYWMGTSDLEQHSAYLGQSMAAGAAAGGAVAGKDGSQWQEQGLQDST